LLSNFALAWELARLVYTLFIVWVGGKKKEKEERAKKNKKYRKSKTLIFACLAQTQATHFALTNYNFA
jgi:hypothetical protein